MLAVLVQEIDAVFARPEGLAVDFEKSFSLIDELHSATLVIASLNEGGAGIGNPVCRRHEGKRKPDFMHFRFGLHFASFVTITHHNGNFAYQILDITVSCSVYHANIPH